MTSLDTAQNFELIPKAVVPGRDCAECSLCCKTIEVPELAKPAGRWCSHARPGKGCGIHDTRPNACATFDCYWRLEQRLGPEWKPDRARFVLATLMPSGVLAVLVDPGQPLAWRREPYLTQIRHWADEAIRTRSQVLLMNGRRASVILPQSELYVGELEPGDAIELLQSNGVYSAHLRKAS